MERSGEQPTKTHPQHLNCFIKETLTSRVSPREPRVTPPSSLSLLLLVHPPSSDQVSPLGSDRASGSPLSCCPFQRNSFLLSCNSIFFLTPSVTRFPPIGLYLPSDNHPQEWVKWCTLGLPFQVIKGTPLRGGDANYPWLVKGKMRIFSTPP